MSQPTISRRRLLQGGLSVGALVLGGPLLVACSDDDDAKPSQATTGGGSGGTLRLAATGGAEDTLDPSGARSRTGFTIFRNVLDPIATFSPDGSSSVLAAAESIEPNADASTWTVRLRDGMTFHDGRPVTAADAMFSLRSWAKETSAYATLFLDVDIANLRGVDDLTFEIPLTRPRADLIDSVLAAFSYIIPDGTTEFSKLIGSGPFRLESFQPGQIAVLARNDDFRDGPPELDGVELQTISDATARFNALKSGQVDFAADILPTAAKAEKGNGDLEIVRSGAGNSVAYGFIMNNQVAPFDDPNVRRAFRLAIDRQTLVDTVLFGEGQVGNDMIGIGLPGYPNAIAQQKFDVDEAKRLIGAAKVGPVKLRVADLHPGMVDAANLYAQQLSDVGVEVTVDEVPADSFFEDFALVASTPFQAFATDNDPGSYFLAATTGAHAFLPLGGTTSADYNALLDRAQSTVDDAERVKLFEEVQRLDREEGGFIWWGFSESLHAERSGVANVITSKQALVLSTATVD